MQYRESAFPRTYSHEGHNGMTIRDYFAGQALIYLSNRKDMQMKYAKDLAKLSYELADAMLAERRKPNG